MFRNLYGYLRKKSMFAGCVVAVGCVSGIFLGKCVFGACEVIGDSMSPSYYDGDVVYFDRNGEVVRGCSVLANIDGTILIKRVVGMPGECVQVINNSVFIDGKYLKEEYLEGDVSVYNGGLAEGKGITLGSSEYFLMGDNRSDSYDSRDMGGIAEEDILGVIW